MVGGQLKMTLGWVGPFPFCRKEHCYCEKLIEEDARYPVQEIEELSGINSSSVLKILRERLGLRKICARWGPHLLTDKQKQSRVRLATQVIEKYDKCDPRRLEEIVTGDETWIYHFQPDSKAKNKVWVHLRATDLSLRAIAKHQTACCMRYSLIRKVQSFRFLDHPPYSPDLSPCDFWLFPRL